MPLVPCPACQREISTAAAACPHCGHPLMHAAVGRSAPVFGPEQTLWQGRPSLKALFGPILAAVAYAVAIPLAVVWLYEPVLRLLSGASADLARTVAENQAGVRLGVIAVVVAIVGVRLLRLLWQILVLRHTSYRVTSQRILIESGVFSRRIDEIDMRTVEDIEFRQTFLQRLLRIGHIGLLGADRTTGRVDLIGIERPREVRETIRSGAFAATRGQLFTRET